ncbi:hypothetical protein [Prosthecobacter sp.]|uniref:hypothetical protein n=1 Tax=Prosthecobacter sp. TaxID=1965333 RepID=UPI003783FA4E
MTSLLPKLDSSRRSLSEHDLGCLHAHMEKPGMNPSTVRMALVLLATLTVILAAAISVAEL